MPQTNLIDLEVYPADEAVDTPLTFTDVNYVSFVSSPGGQGEGTYGIPAMLADRSVKIEGLPVTIVYINPANVAAIKAVRKQ